MLKARKTQELRAVIINKKDGTECAANIMLDAGQAGRYANRGEAQVLARWLEAGPLCVGSRDACGSICWHSCSCVRTTGVRAHNWPFVFSTT